MLFDNQLIFVTFFRFHSFDDFIFSVGEGQVDRLRFFNTTIPKIEIEDTFLVGIREYKLHWT